LISFPVAFYREIPRLVSLYSILAEINVKALGEEEEAVLCNIPIILLSVEGEFNFDVTRYVIE